MIVLFQRDRRLSYSSTEDETEEEEEEEEEREREREKERKKRRDQNSVEPNEGLKIPAQKYVVRPAPIPAPPKYVETVDGQNHHLPFDCWMNIFRCLPRQDLCACMRVCRVWNRWCIDRQLWANIDLSRRRITKDHLVGVVRRQPQSLDLSFCNISRKQLEWLVSRLPQLRHLNLAGNSWAAVSALCSSSCPLLFSLDLRWVQGIRDPCLRDLLNPPTDHRPGVDDTRSRLYRLQSLLLAGSDVSDASVKVIVQQLNRLVRLDLSYCTMVSDASVACLSGESSPLRSTLSELDLTGCNQLTINCFQSIAKLTNIQRVFLKNCPHLLPDMFKQFEKDNPRFNVFEDFCLDVRQ